MRLKRVGKLRGKPTSFHCWHQVSHQMKFRPLHDRVVVCRLNAEEKPAGGIIIPDNALENPMEGGSSLSVSALVTDKVTSSPTR